MFRNTTRKLTIVLTLALLAAPLGKAIAQSTTPPPPNVITGTNPPPKGSVVQAVLVFLHLA
jgi:hypothetical protein